MEIFSRPSYAALTSRGVTIVCVSASEVSLQAIGYVVLVTGYAPMT